MLLNFQRQFARPVWAGQKRQTIRSAGKRVHVPKVGELAHCYTGLRTRSTVRLGVWPISSVQVLRMEVDGHGLSGVVLGDSPASSAQLRALAQQDGFADAAAMGKWFAENHEPGDFYGWVVGWDWSPVPEIVLPFEKKGGAA
ncbi:MAG: hypothetical protein KKG67_20545 [Gammaproteobacteria bacterium]|nr:hypothetical protein [Gammaproteobacteria bacterium]